jgi:hypothetical protein
MMREPTTLRENTNLPSILLVCLLGQLTWIFPLWSHVSTPAVILGRFSFNYSLVLTLHLLLILGLCIALFVRPHLEHLKEIVPRSIIYLSISFFLCLAVYVTFTGIEPQIKHWIWLNCALLAGGLIIIYPLPVTIPHWEKIWIAISVLLIVPTFITNITIDSFNPDEAQLLDYGSTWFSEGKIYNSTFQDYPFVVKPGWPYQLVIFAWLTEHFDNTIRVGRIINLTAFYIASVGLFLATVKLYDIKTALVTMFTFLLSSMFLTEWDYAPKHLLVIIATWVLLLVILGRSAKPGFIRSLIHALVGLVVTSSLNLHASGVIFAVVWSLWYVGRAILARDRDTVLDMVSFGMGTLIGTSIYWFTNIQPGGGLYNYVSVLNTLYSKNDRNPFFFYTWDSALERLLILLGIAWMLLRRNSKDALILSLIFITIGVAWIIDKQGYIWSFAAYYPIPIGVLLVQSTWLNHHSNRTWIINIVLFLMLLPMLSYIRWDIFNTWIRTNSLPSYLYDELKDSLPNYILDSDVIYSTHQLLWVFPNSGQPRVISHASEVNAMHYFNLDEPIQVWERVKPTVIIFVENHMNYDPGMVAYLEQHPFELCHTLTVQDRQITILRPDCSVSPMLDE